ncbi:SMAD/FHA domain-containing protein [Backusella circina FSU 941]|nr:SMAD/FHA domain-containing protein [Backusella circina FSU 941]
MADFICLAMATQYTEQNGSDSSSNNSFRRSLNFGQSTLFGTGRRPSRSTTSNTRPGSNNFESSIIEESAVHPTSQIASPVHVRIVPSIDNPSRSLVFSIIERDLEAGRVIKIGRFTDRISIQNHISFKSKVVSRSHCEIWLDNDGKVCLRDTKSSSGTFLNHVRLSPANQESRPVEVRDGDLVQLGVDYQGGLEEIYRAVKMRFEINRPQQQRPVSYSMSAFNNLRNLTHISTQMNQEDQSNGKQIIYGNQNKHVTELLYHTALACHNNSNCNSSGSHHHDVEGSSGNSGNGGDGQNDIQVEECCICLYALAPFQALFVAPCSHSYHFKCIRPLLDSYPGFQCPICRTYSDLDASVAIEAEEVIEKFGLRKPSVPSSPINHESISQNNHVEDPACSSSNAQPNNNMNEESVSSEVILPTSNNASPSSSSGHQNSDLIPSQTILYSAPIPEPPLSTTLVACTTSLSGILSEQHVDGRFL